MLTLTQVKNAAKECTAEMNQLGITVPKEVTFRVSSRMTRALGNCLEQRRYNGQLVRLQVSISHQVTPEILKDVVMHELIHATVGGRAGHGWAFQSMAQKLNKAYGYQIGTYASEKESTIIQAVRRAEGHSVHCTQCGMTQAITARHGVFKNPEKYRCNCGGKLEVK